MLFTFTLNMANSSGKATHNVIGDAGDSLDSFHALVSFISNNEFLVVDEFYKHGEQSELRPASEVAINCRLIGKVKTFNPQGD